MTTETSSQKRSGRCALVTGASSGIGKAYAERLASSGWDLIVVARRVDALDHLAVRLREQCGVAVDVVAADLTDRDDLERVAGRVTNCDHLELLVNNAGFGNECYFHRADVSRELEMVRLNVEALVRLTHAALTPMIERGRGSVINISSGAGFGPTPFFAVYGATKAFVTSFTEAIYEELAGTGVSVQVVCPGFTRTEFQQVAGTDASRFPSFLWQSAEEVVDASLAALAKGTLVCIPGLMNQALMSLRGPISRVVTRKLFGIAGRQALG